MADDDRELGLRDYGRILYRRKWIVVGATLAALVGALILSLVQTPIYQAESQMLVEPRSGETVFTQDPTLNVQNLDRAIQTEIQVLEGQRVRERVRVDLGLDELPPHVDGSAVSSTDVVSIRVRSSEPEAAQQLADAYVAAYTATRQEQARAGLQNAADELESSVADLQTQIDVATAEERATLVAQQAQFRQRLDQLRIERALTTGGTSVVKAADLPTDPVEPTPARTAMLAGVLGLLLGLGSALLLDHLDDSVKSHEDLERLTDFPVLGVVPVDPPPDHRPIAVSQPQDFAVEIYRGLRTNVQFLGLDQPMRIIQVTSSLPGEGKTTTATNLAVVLAQAGNKVAVVDADLRKPRVHEVFAVPARPGLTEVLLGDPAEMAINRLEGGLRIIPAGAVPPNPSEMLSHPRVSRLLLGLAERYDYVIVDTPPVLPVTDALTLSRAVHGVVFVAQSGRVSEGDVRESLLRLERVHAPVIGIVLNRAQRSGGRGTYGYGYGYRYEEASAPPEVTTSDPTPAVVPADGDG